MEKLTQQKKINNNAGLIPLNSKVNRVSRLVMKILVMFAKGTPLSYAINVGKNAEGDTRTAWKIALLPPSIEYRKGKSLVLWIENIHLYRTHRDDDLHTRNNNKLNPCKQYK